MLLTNEYHNLVEVHQAYFSKFNNCYYLDSMISAQDKQTTSTKTKKPPKDILFVILPRI